MPIDLVLILTANAWACKGQSDRRKTESLISSEDRAADSGLDKRTVVKAKDERSKTAEFKRRWWAEGFCTEQVSSFVWIAACADLANIAYGIGSLLPP
ncbi:hypothetical protein Baya_13735 [Bagarius yarrelli]|uniref:Uncharacterized protein n=1 Tax=Bagarius yarrelli TaxID=175774 RepID=A0A556V6X2_BAGYA|nr:hypothetical protein Baya_13735 [Bagarius yarrelli]